MKGNSVRNGHIVIMSENMKEKIFDALIEESKQELFHYPVYTKKQDLKYLIKRVLKPKDTPKRDGFFWPHAMLAQALEGAGELETLIKYYDAWIENGLSIYNVDNIMNGYSLLYVYEKTGKEKYKQAADKLYNWICEYAKQMGNPMPYRKHHPYHVYVDGLGMVVPFLCRYGAMFQKEEAITLGVEQIKDFLCNGMDKVTGLPYHGYDTKSKEKQGIIGWGRAVGWLMLAMADSIEYIAEEECRKELIREFTMLTKATLKYLREDGYFSWQLSAVEGPKDTSTTAMIGYAFKKSISINTKLQIENNIEEIKVKEVLAKIESAIRNSYKEGKIYDCSGECDGFSQYPQRYGSYPWSLGPGLRFLLVK